MEQELDYFKYFGQQIEQRLEKLDNFRQRQQLPYPHFDEVLLRHRRMSGNGTEADTALRDRPPHRSACLELRPISAFQQVAAEPE